MAKAVIDGKNNLLLISLEKDRASTRIIINKKIKALESAYATLQHVLSDLRKLELELSQFRGKKAAENFGQQTRNLANLRKGLSW